MDHPTEARMWIIAAVDLAFSTTTILVSKEEREHIENCDRCKKNYEDACWQVRKLKNESTEQKEMTLTYY